jgi:hypothetical protein
MCQPGHFSAGHRWAPALPDEPLGAVVCEIAVAGNYQATFGDAPARATRRNDLGRVSMMSAKFQKLVKLVG